MSGSAPRLLFLCHTLPYPPDGGVWIRSYHTLRQLSRAFDVRALCFERSSGRDHDVEGAIQHLSTLAPTEAFPLPQHESRIRRVLDHVASLLTRRVFTHYRHRFRPFRRRLQEMLDSGDFDLVHVDSLDLVRFLPLLEDHTVSLVHHNVESQLLRRRAEAEDSPLAARYLALQAKLQREEEQHWCPIVSVNISVSEEDRLTLSKIAPGARIEVVPNGVDVETFKPDTLSDGQEGLIFVGGAGWFPNRDGMQHFADEILPRIRQRAGTEVPVTWVGNAGSETRSRFESDHGIRMTGFVEDIRPYVHRAACFIVPLRVGGGSRLKILDAWAMGKPVVSTTRGCEGLETDDGENILIRDEAGAFADAVVDVLHDEALRHRLGRRARHTAVEFYSWSKIGENLNSIYLSLLSAE